VEGSGPGKIIVLSWYLLGGAEENNEKYQSGYPGYGSEHWTLPVKMKSADELNVTPNYEVPSVRLAHSLVPGARYNEPQCN
jgi:hypothetical protein